MINHFLYGVLIVFVILMVLTVLIIVLEPKFSIKDKDDSKQAPYKIEPPTNFKE